MRLPSRSVRSAKASKTVFARDTVPEIVREFIIDSADATMTRRGAHIVLDIMSRKRSVNLSNAATKQICGNRRSG
jgi:hypothetical protein